MTFTDSSKMLVISGSGTGCYFACKCSSWNMEKDLTTIECYMDKSERNLLFQSIKPGAVEELYEILGETHYVDSTYSNANTIYLYPIFSLSSLRCATKLYVKDYMEEIFEGTDEYFVKFSGYSDLDYWSDWYPDYSFGQDDYETVRPKNDLYPSNTLYPGVKLK